MQTVHKIREEISELCCTWFAGWAELLDSGVCVWGGGQRIRQQSGFILKWIRLSLASNSLMNFSRD